jgi:hypothetical protein
MMSDEDKVRHNARRRAARKANNLDAELDKIYSKPIEEWDTEEIQRGRPRGADGTFRGRKPKWITPAIQSERQRRLRQLMMDDLGTFAGDALRLIHTEMMNKGVGDDGKPLVPASVRVDAAKYLVDQFIGKAKVSVDVHEDNSLLDLMGGLLVNPDGMPSHHIVVDGDVVDPEDDPASELRSMD